MHVASVPDPGVIAAILPTVGIRCGYRNDIRRQILGRYVRSRYFVDRLRVAVIGVGRHDDTGSASGGSGNAQCEFVCFTSRAAEHGRIELCRQPADQSFGTLEDVVVQVACMRI